jgi:predicted Zn-dependent protease
VDNAIKLSAGKAPESWYLLKMAAHYELKQYKPATEVLTALVDRYPEKKKYWTQLSAMHMQAGNDAKATAALKGYNLGMLTEANELQRLANYLAFAGIPHRAARVMEKAMKEGRSRAPRPTTRRWPTTGIRPRSWTRPSTPWPSPTSWPPMPSCSSRWRA